jgi:hypothetical protein
MNRRSVSVTLNYVLVLAITAVLITGLIIAGGTFVEDQREQVIEGELRIIGNHLAGNMEQVDRYVRASESGNPPEAYVNQTFGTDATGSTYGVELAERDGTAQVVLNSTDPDISVRVNATVQTDVDEGSFANGGEISVAYDQGADELVIRNA